MADKTADPLVPFRSKGTIYRGPGAPWPPGSVLPLPKSHADALAAGGHAYEEPKSEDAKPAKAEKTKAAAAAAADA